jgi:hypothetical protein
MGLSTGELLGEFSGVGFSPKRAHLEQIQPMSLAVDADHEVLPRISTEVEDMLHSMFRIREWVSWPLSPCSESAGGGSYAWRGKLLLDSDVSRLIGLGLPLNHSQHDPFFPGKS